MTRAKPHLRAVLRLEPLDVRTLPSTLRATPPLSPLPQWGEELVGGVAAAEAPPDVLLEAPAVSAAGREGEAPAEPAVSARQEPRPPGEPRPLARSTAPVPTSAKRVYSVEAVAAAMDRLAGDVTSHGRPWTYGEIILSTGALAGVGYVLLNTRLLAWLLSVVFAKPLVWERLDPLEVLYAWERRKARGGNPASDAEESLASLLD